MLKHKINYLKNVVRYDALKASDFSSHGNEIYFYVDEYGNILKNNIISFYRKDGTIEYSDDKIVECCEFLDSQDPNNGIQKVTIRGFSNIDLKIVSAYTKNVSGENYVFFKFDKKHYANSYREKGIKAFLDTDEGYSELCDGDDFIKYDYFVFEKNGGSASRINATCTIFWEDTFGNKYHADGLVPVSTNGHDMEKTIMFSFRGDIMNLYSNQNSKCWVKDNRFFKYEIINEETDRWRLYLTNGTKVRIRKGDAHIDIPINTDFSTQLFVDDSIDAFLKEEADKRIVSSLDYEKQQFTPVIVDNEAFLDIFKITFLPYLRTRDEDFNVLPDYGWEDLEEDGQQIIKNGIFTKEDIYYEHKCVSESFLRLSFYDSISRGTQKLLYTAKIYLDENSLWTKYVKSEDEQKEEVVLSFTVSNKNDYGNKTEGFYLHLFPGNIRELTDTENPATIYMKAEFCHAKYGKTIPLSMNAYPNTTNDADITYVEKTYLKISDGNMYTDMADLYNDMYAKITLKYDESNRRYVWYFENASVLSANELKIKLLEPKIF